MNERATGAAEEKAARKWGDLLPRIIVAAALVVIGGGALVAGGAALGVVVVVACCIMIWELARMTRAPVAGGVAGGGTVAILLGILGGGVLALNFGVAASWPLALLLLPSLCGVLMPRRDPWAFAGYAVLILLLGLCIVLLRETLGLAAALAVVLAVIASDVAGYFVGRWLGGPRLWPRVSPNKTWSGTIAGWLGAALVGGGFWLFGLGDAALMWMLPLLALAGQAGDIAESALKRRMGVKDSSNILPGHGGLMDRFDALGPAVVLAVLVQSLMPFLPPGAG